MAERNLLAMTATITASFVQNNRVEADGVGSLIAAIHRALAQVENSESDQPIEAQVAKATAAQIRKSQSGEKLISFEDGRAYSSLKRHLTGLGLTPETYRAKWGLPTSYPMVAPAYSARRSALAKALGLGSKGRGGKPTKAPEKAKRRRPAKAGA